ncbi:MAG: efflux RND transporter periplasmic adaptor subunit [Alphaproteobacteria bacterium]|nr:efflux RND transporter periplasmic adaptor subunit [Alphaproteobacteria bacterium]
MNVNSPDSSFDSPRPEDLDRLRPPPRRWPWALAGLGALLLAGGVGFALLSGGDDEGWQTEAVTRGALDQRVTAVGQLEPVDVVEVGSDLTGRLSSVSVEKNTEVKAGDVLAQLDPEPFEHAVSRARSQVDSARAGLAQAKAQRDDAVLTRDRTARLLERGVSSASELEAAELQVRVMEASVLTAAASLEQARASLADAETDLADTTIRSPIDGVVIQRYVDPGQTVVSSMSATALFEVASDLGALEVEVGVDEADVAMVRAGQSATFTVSAFPTQSFSAEVVSVDLAPDPDESVVTYNADLRVDNADGLLRPGMTATADILVDQLPDALQVPTLALGYRPSREGPEADRSGGARIYVLRDGQPVAVAVESLGSDGANSAVLPKVEGALQVGDLVVLGGGR